MAFLTTYSVGTRAFIDTLKGRGEQIGINTLLNYVKNLLTEDGVKFLKDTISFSESVEFAEASYGDPDRWANIIQVRQEAKRQRQAIGITDISEVDFEAETLKNDLLLDDDSDRRISHCFDLSSGRNRFCIKDKNIGVQVIPSSSEVQAQVFPHESPNISVFTPDTEGGPRPRTGAAMSEEYEFECVLYVTGYKPKELEARAALLGQCIKLLVLQDDLETPINKWRDGELYFARQAKNTAPIANTRFLTRLTIIFAIQKDQIVPTL